MNQIEQYSATLLYLLNQTPIDDEVYQSDIVWKEHSWSRLNPLICCVPFLFSVLWHFTLILSKLNEETNVGRGREDD